MKLKWLGHSCFEITLDNGHILVTDPYDGTVGYPPLHARADVALSSHGHFDHNCFDALEGDFEIINRPGEYARFGAKITGVPSFHDEVKGAKRGKNVIFAVEADGVKLVHLGDLGHQPDTDAQRALITGADVLLIPIGGTFTLTTPEAVKLIEDFKPAAAVAMHFSNQYCRFNITGCDEFVRLTGAKKLPNAVEIAKGGLNGCYVMEID